MDVVSMNRFTACNTPSVNLLTAFYVLQKSEKRNLTCVPDIVNSSFDLPCLLVNPHVWQLENLAVSRSMLCAILYTLSVLAY